VIINFALGMAIQRALPRDAVLSPAGARRMTASSLPDWYEQVYQEHSDLLGTQTEKRK
jgi:hypothetical protein